MEKKLRNLYTLQLVDSKLDDLEELKGDLPSEVRTLDDQVSELKRQLAEHELTMKTSFAQRDESDSKIVELKERLEKYKTQQFKVRNNREYDALTKEMDIATESIARLEKEMEAHEGKATIARSDIEKTKLELEQINLSLAEKRAELAEVSKATEDEEQKYQHEREKAVAHIAKSDLATYERIRKAKQGKAVVPVKRGACGGCFTRVPPQKLLELRQNAKLFTCERCGRILVSDELAETSSASAS